jgi:hypothetical protein
MKRNQTDKSNAIVRWLLVALTAAGLLLITVPAVAQDSAADEDALKKGAAYIFPKLYLNLP